MVDSLVSREKRRVTSDFDSMINIIIFNSLGFFFLDFLIPYVASQELQAAGIDMGIIFSVIVVGYIHILFKASSS